MRPTRVALLAALGMLLTSVSVYSFTPPGGFSHRAGHDAVQGDAVVADPAESVPAPPADLARFVAGTTLTVEGRAGNARLARDAGGETYLMLEVHGAKDLAAKAAAPVNLAIVIDRSGSMKGTRIRNAVAAATTAVDRLNEGDVVSVVTFDTQTQVVVPPTPISAFARDRVKEAIRGIGLGGDTCISCGLEEGMAELAQTVGKVNRMILLSDGDANHGVRDVPGFRNIAQRAQAKGVSVTTIGVDVDYNEKIMAAIAQDSNGRHYFVADDTGLSRVFEEEAQSLTRTIASGAEIAIDLAPGVELERVLDRSFRRAGGRIVVPLGTFEGLEVKSVLMKVRLGKAPVGPAELASVELTYHDLVQGTDGRCAGKLGVEVVPTAAEATDLDAVVSGRVQRSETAAVLKDANSLFEQGRGDEARRRLQTREDSLHAALQKADHAAPPARKKDVERDFDNQLAAVDGANQGFATPPPAPGPAAARAAPQETRAGKSAVKQNQASAVRLGL
jgi:Ca-activated chloride channel family protein